MRKHKIWILKNLLLYEEEQLEYLLIVQAQMFQEGREHIVRGLSAAWEWWAVGHNYLTADTAPPGGEGNIRTEDAGTRSETTTTHTAINTTPTSESYDDVK